MFEPSRSEPQVMHPRRAVLQGACAAVGALSAPWLRAQMVSPPSSAAPGPHVLPPLPFADNALDPVMSATTLGYHHGKHHKAYVDNLNKLLAGTEQAALPLDKLILATSGRPDQQAVFNNAAQVWNHTFFWQGLKAQGGGEPPAALMNKVKDSFGSVAQLKKDLLAASLGQFGSGWAWLVQDGDRLKVVKSSGGDNPMTAGLKPLLAIDVWEHAYYLDYQNRRADYVNAVLDKLVNWEFVAGQLKA